MIYRIGFNFFSANKFRPIDKLFMGCNAYQFQVKGLHSILILLNILFLSL